MSLDSQPVKTARERAVFIKLIQIEIRSHRGWNSAAKCPNLSCISVRTEWYMPYCLHIVHMFISRNRVADDLDGKCFR